MNQISVPPGAFKFRLLVIIIVVTLLMLAFLNYTNGISASFERTSVRQTKNIINSTLAVVFANHTVRGELGSLNEVNGGNPFEYLEKYGSVPTTYRGEISIDNLKSSNPGWYFDRAKGLALYKPYYDDQVYYFMIVLDYRDVDGSDHFEPDIDEFQKLSMKQLPRQ